MEKYTNVIKLNKVLEEVNNLGYQEINIENYFDGMSEQDIDSHLNLTKEVKEDLTNYIQAVLNYDQEVAQIKDLINNLF